LRLTLCLAAPSSKAVKADSLILNDLVTVFPDDLELFCKLTARVRASISIFSNVYAARPRARLLIPRR
jgi:hypothetical protein